MKRIFSSVRLGFGARFCVRAVLILAAVLVYLNARCGLPKVLLLPAATAIWLYVVVIVVVVGLGLPIQLLLLPSAAPVMLEEAIAEEKLTRQDHRIGLVVLGGILVLAGWRWVGLLVWIGVPVSRAGIFVVSVLAGRYLATRK